MSDAEIERNLSILRSTRRSYICAIQKAKGHFRSSERLRNAFSGSAQCLSINLSPVRATRRNEKRSKSQSNQPTLTPTLANVPCMGITRSQEISSRSFESDRLGEMRKPFRLAKRLVFSNCSSVITAGGKDAAVDNENDYEDSFEIFNPRGNVRSKFNLPHYGLSVNMFEYGSYTRSTLNGTYSQPTMRSSSWIGSMLNSPMNAWTIVKRKVGDIFYLNITKPYRYIGSSQCIYGRREPYRKWLLTGWGWWWPILVFIFAILTIAFVLCVSHAQCKYVTLFAALLYGALWDTVNVMYDLMLLPLVSVVCAFMGGYAACAYKKCMPIEVYRQHQQLVDMTETIIHYMKLRNAMNVEYGLMDTCARVDHVRDILIPRWQRERMDPVWQKAVQFISANENVCHIRTKRLRVFEGKEVLVWKWTELVDKGQHEEEKETGSTRTR